MKKMGIIHLKIINYCYYNILEDEDNPENIGPVLVLLCRDRDNKFHMIRVHDKKLSPRFYVDRTPENLEIILENNFRYKEWHIKSAYGEELYKIETDFPYEVGRIRKLFDHTYQAGIIWEKVAINELGITSYFKVPKKKYLWYKADEVKPLLSEEWFPIKHRITAYDIETDTRPLNNEKISIHNIGNMPIITITFYDNYINQYDTFVWHPNTQENHEEIITYKCKLRRRILKGFPRESKVYIHWFKTEKEMLSGFFEEFGKRHFDAKEDFNGSGGYMIGSKKSKSFRVWNNGFDMPALYLRAERLGILHKIQYLSPLPNIKDKFGRWIGVYKRGKGDKFEIVVRGLASFDFRFLDMSLKYSKEYQEFKGGSLDKYMTFFLKMGKIKHRKEAVWEMWLNNIYKEIRYNIRDVEGTYLLCEFFGIPPTMFERATITGCKPEDGDMVSYIHRHLTLKYSKGICIYDTRYQNWKRKTYKGKFKSREGGFVFDPRVGIYNIANDIVVVVIDFNKLYPNLIISCNAGPRTKIDQVKEGWFCVIDKEGKVWDKKDIIHTPVAYYRKDIISINRKIYNDLLLFRKKYEDLRDERLKETNNPEDLLYKLYNAIQFAIKFLINGRFGTTGLSTALDYDIAVYNTAPVLGQDLIKYIYRIIDNEVEDVNIIGGDTDSVFVAIKASSLSDGVRKAKDIVDILNKNISKYMIEKCNVSDHTIELGVETASTSFVLYMKKHYVMKIGWEKGIYLEKPHILYKGFELLKSDSSKITEIIQKQFMKFSLESKNTKEAKKKIDNYIKKIDKVLYEMPWSLVSPRGSLRRDMDSYNASYPIAKAFRFSRDYFGKELYPGDNPFIAPMKKHPSDVTRNHLDLLVAFDEYDIPFLKEKGFEIDIEKLKKKQVVQKLNNLLKMEIFDDDYYSIIKRDKVADVMEP